MTEQSFLYPQFLAKMFIGLTYIVRNQNARKRS